MTRARVAPGAAALVLVSLLVWVLFVGLPRWTAPRPAEPPPAAASAAAPAEPARKIRARLYYLSEDGARLQPADRL